MGTKIDNPEKAALKRLLDDVTAAAGGVPDVDQPTSVIGPGPAWTGTKADETHNQDLAPIAQPFKTALTAVVTDVHDAWAACPAKVDAEASTAGHPIPMAN